MSRFQTPILVSSALSCAQPEWISPAVWRNILFLDRHVKGRFQGFAQAVAAEEGEWKDWIKQNSNNLDKLPQLNGQDLDPFESLAVIKALKCVVSYLLS